MTESRVAGLMWRPLVSGDAAALTALLEVVESVDGAGEHYSEADVLAQLLDPVLEPAKDTVGAFAGTMLVGYAKVSGRSAVRDVDRMIGEGAVHPDFRGRGVGAALVDWQVLRSEAKHLERFPDVPGELHAYLFEANTAQCGVYAARGFQPTRWFLEMTRDLTAELGVVTDLAGGLRVVPFDPAYDERVRLAHGEAFADHVGSVPPDADTWRHWFTGAGGFRGALSAMVLDGEEVAGYLLGYENDADEQATGARSAVVGQIGTRRAWRKRGVASALLSRFLVTARGDGYLEAALGVDADNPTGVLGLYERHGFRTEHTFVRYVGPACRASDALGQER